MTQSSVRVLALTRYDHLGASSRVRVLQYIPHLKENGIDVIVHPLFTNDDLRRLYKSGRRSALGLMAAFVRRLGRLLRAGPVDVIWLQQEIFPFLPYFAEGLLLSGRKLVVDYDDANHLYYETLGSTVGRALYEKKIAHLMKRADVVVTGSPAMTEYARASGARRVELAYSAVDTKLIVPSPDHDPSNPFTVGWIGTPLTATQSLPLLAAPLRRFLSETDSRACFVGMDAHQFPDLPGERIRWSPSNERENLSRLSVGLCPLEDNPWTRGKSGYKIIQYMSAGTPTLASPIGIAADLVQEGITGFHCRTEDDWYMRLVQLFRDPALGRDLGRHSRETAVSRYDALIAANALIQIFRECRGE